MFLDSSDIQYLLGNDSQLIQRRSALFLLKLKEHHKISQAGVDDIVKDSRDLYSSHNFTGRSKCKGKIRECCRFVCRIG